MTQFFTTPAPTTAEEDAWIEQTQRGMRQMGVNNDVSIFWDAICANAVDRFGPRGLHVALLAADQARASDGSVSVAALLTDLEDDAVSCLGAVNEGDGVIRVAMRAMSHIDWSKCAILSLRLSASPGVVGMDGNPMLGLEDLWLSSNVQGDQEDMTVISAVALGAIHRLLTSPRMVPYRSHIAGWLVTAGNAA